MAEEIEVPGKAINLGGASQGIPVYTPVGPGSMGGGSPRLSSDQLYAGIETQSGALPNVSASSLPDSSRYNVYIPGRDMEEMYGQQQGTWEKWGSGFGKMVGTATTSFLNGTVGTVYGIGAMIRDAKVSSFYDNEFGRDLDSTNKYLENALPNFYTKAERDASWYSPDNILTANFFSDKVLKNLGYSIGSIGAGFAWGGVLRSIGLTNRLVQAGKGLETVQAVENAILTAPKIGRYGAVNNALTGLSNQYLKPFAAKVLTNADRGLTSVFGTMGEASFESLQNLNTVREKMIQSYISKYGEEPTGTALDEINDYAEKVGNYTWGMNVALLSATNYIQLPKILNSSKVAERRMMNQIVKETVEKGTTLAERTATKYIKAPNLLETIAGKPGRLFNKYVVNPAGLFFAPSEAFEEGAQFAIQVGTEDYFSRAYEVNDDISSFWENVSGAFENVLGEGISETLSSKEGLEGILIGGLSGGIQTSFSPFGQNTIKERGFFGDGGIRGTNTEDAIKAINDSKNINQVLKDRVKYANIAVNSQKLRQEAIANNDTLNEKDYEQDYSLSYIMPRVKYGKVDSIKEEIGLYKQQALTDQGFQELQNEGVVLTGETREKFIQRLDNITQTANQVNKTFELFDDKYSVLLDKDGKRLYSDDLIEKMTYASAKVIDYDKRTSELQSKLASQNILTSELDRVLSDNSAWKTGNLKNALNDKDVQDAILKISKDVENLESINQDEINEELSDYIDLTIRRKSFLEDFNKIKSNPEEFKTKEPVAPENALTPPPLKPGEKVPTVTITTKTGDKEIEIGTEYFLGRVVGKDKNGKDVYRLPRLTVLGENEDGTIQIKDNNGIRNISKEEFEDYKLAKVETTLSNKKAKYFLENWNTKFEFNFGKGVKQIGRLEWNDKDRILTFVYLNKKGERKEIEVTGDQFEAQKGFKDPMIKAIGTLTRAQEQAQEEMIEGAKTDPRVSAKRAERIRILSELFDELSVRQDKTIALIDRKQKQIAKIKEDLAKLEQEIANAEVDGRAKNSVRFKSATKKALANAISLSRTQTQLEEQLVYLENDSQELDFNLSYISDLISNVDLLPTDSRELLEELNDNILNLEVLQETTYKQISTIVSLIKETEKAVNSFIDFISNLIEKFEAKFPNVPRIMGQDYVDFLKTNPNFLKLKPYYREELSELDELIGIVEDGDITPNQTKIDNLKEHLAIMEQDAQELQKEIDVKTLVLKKFEEVAEKYKAQQAEEQKLQRDEKLIQQFIGTLGGYTQTHVNDKSYEAAAKKTEKEVVTSTIGSSEKDASKPFNIRLKNFAFKFNKLTNRDSLRGVIVTNNTQDDIIPGLTEHLMSGATEEQKAKYDHTKTIVMVMTDADGKPVDENGVTIPEGADLLNTAIYQVFPTEKLVAEYNGKVESMFREGTDPKVEESLRKQYAAWRTSILERTELSKPVSITRSFGIAQYSKTIDDKGKEKINYDSRNSVEGAGLVTADDLVESQAITVATTNDSISYGQVTFNTPLGGVFLKVKDGLYKLFNRKFNEKEANVIYDVIHQLSKNALNEGKVGPESTSLINWLKSVVYWGINKTPEGERKEAGYNSVWFENVKEDGVTVPKLFISGKEKDSTQQFDFTPTGLEARKGDIILLLSNLYNNTDAKLTNNSSAYNNEYYQITGINSEGKPITTVWPNYQSYLLASKNPDGSPRDIPLTTPIRELNGEEDVNKDGYYFTLNDSSEFEIPQLISEAPQVPQAPVVSTETPTAAPTLPVMQPQAPAVSTPQGFNLEGGENVVPLGSFGNVRFTLDGKKYIETDGKEGLGVNAPGEVIQAIALAKNKSKEEAFDIIVNSIVAKFKPQLEAMSLTSPETIEEVAEAAPINNPVTEEEVEETDDKLAEILARAAKIAPRDNEAYRVKLEEELNDFTPEDWSNIENFIKKVLPTVPFYRVKNLLQATNGRQAWGMLREGSIYVYENAEVGTAYHEVFEAIWKMFSTPEEKQAIFKEFKNRKGSFVDRETGETVNYKDANANQIKEQLAEEFRDFVLTGTHVDTNQGKSFIGRLFSDIVDFIKSFFTGEKALNNTQQLFENITSGYYAKYNPYESNLSYANKGIIDVENVETTEGAEFRLVTIPAQQMIDIVEDMTYSTLATLSKNNQDLFTAGNPLNRNQVIDRLKEEISNRILEQIKILNSIKNDPQTIESDKKKATINLANKVNLLTNVEANWDVIIKRYDEKLKTFSIEFDENNNILVTNEDNSGREDYVDSRKIDDFRKANSAVKLLFGTLARTVVDKTGKIELDPSTIGGAQLIPSDKVFITLKNALYDSLNVDEMFLKLKAIGQSNSDYAVLYERITRSKITESIDFDKLQEHDLQLISAFWKAMKGQNANVISVFTLPSGQIVIGDSNLSQASRQAKRELSSEIIKSIKTDNAYVKYDYKTNKYNAAVNSKGEKVIDSYRLQASELKSYVSFLKNIGVTFDEKQLEEKLDDNQLAQFKEVVQGIKSSLSKIKDVASLSPTILGIDGRLLELGAIQSIIEYPEFESTYFNVNGERTQTYLGTNALSELYATLTSIKNINELQGTNYAYLLTDVFSKGDASVLLNKMFNVNGSGNRREGTERLLHPVYIDGSINEKKGKKTESSKLTIKQRIVQEINLNLSGVFMNLIPGDASIEWAIRMFEQKSPFVTKEGFDNKQYLNIFRNYFISEVNLAKDDRKTAKPNNSGELRFFKDILGEDYKKVWNATSKKDSAEKIYDDNKAVIDKAVSKFISNEAQDTRDLLDVYGVTSLNDTGLTVEGLALTEEENITEEELTEKLNILSANYIIANIEMHKVLYSDPYQYKDELKRIKSFLSPRQALLTGSSLLNTAFNKQYNKFFNKTDIGRTDMTKEIFRSSVISDIFSTNELPGYETPFEETDGGGYISLKANRIFGIRAGSWTPGNEIQYRYDIAYEKIVRGENLTDDEKKKQGLVLTEEEKKFNIKKATDANGKVSYVGNNPNVKSTYTTRKPIVSGSKADGKNYNDIVLDKFALTPLSFRVLHQLNPDSNALRLYTKMQTEDVDYVVYNSGRKVGAGISTPLYNSKGEFNINPFAEINNIPFSIMGVQTEVPSKDEALVTQGSQITKLVTLDFLEAGMPIDFMSEEKDFNKRYVQWATLEDKESYNDGNNLYKEIINNQKLLEEKIKQGYETLLTKLGITESVNAKGEKEFNIENVDKLVDTLTDEILKREVNENIIKAFEQFKENKGIILEATPAYQQIRNILYSIANRNVISPKISGGMKVQVSSALLESVRAEGVEYKDEKGNTKIKYASSDLKFYEDEDGQRVCEVMIGRWFKSSMSDEELLNYFNNTPEGQKILRGVAFRIPTQKQNSIDVFKIKKFLPESFGDNVIIPSALVKKTGSDFDIDKLSMYLKNIYTTGRGEIKIVPYLGIGEDAKNKFGEMFDKGEFLTKDQIKELDRYVAETKERELDNTTAEYKLIRDIFPDAFSDEALEKEFIEDLLSNISKKGVRQTIIEDKYMKSLENAYIESLENLVSNPLNFKNLIKPNSAKELNDLSDEIVELTGQKKIDYSAVGNMLSRRFMSSLRQDFVSGKFAIGIAATAQTNHADNQRAFITIDRDRLTTGAISEVDKYWLGDGIINLPHNNVSNKATLSMIDNKDGKSISDIIGQFIDGYVDIAKGPWIMKLGATPNVSGTWLFLTKVGVPIRTTAYFMNQPIVRDYLRNIQSDGYSYLFMDQYVDAAKKQYPVKQDVKATYLPAEKELKEMLGGKDLKPLQNAQQHLILDEFLKYAKMAEHLFKVQQATNFDTANLNDPYLIFKKKVQLERTKNTIISSADDLLETSFRNILKDKIYDVRDAFAKILLSDKKGKVRNMMEAVLLPYVDRSDRDFVKISQTAVNTLFDWAMLTSKHGEGQYSNAIFKTLLGSSTEKSAAAQIIEFRDAVQANPNHPLYNNIVLESLKIEPGSKVTKPDNLYIAGRDNKVYDQNLIIDAFRQIKETLGTENKDLYGKLVRVAILQSGLTVSPISFTSLLPYEDFNEVYNVALSNLENLSNLVDFQKLNVFERTNWSNTDAIPFKSAFLVKNVRGGMTNINEDFLDKRLKTAMYNDDITKVISISVQSPEGRSDFMTYSWQSDVIFDSERGEFVPLTKKLKALARLKGDYSYIKKGLFQKVYTENEEGLRIPYTKKDGKYTNYLYKMVNAWGDSYRANESYDVVKPSVLDNDYQKVIKESTDDDILNTIDYLPSTTAVNEPSTNVNAPEGLPPIDRSNEQCS
jgi:hypothetical protein